MLADSITMAGEPNNSPCLRFVIKDPYKNSQVRDSSVDNLSPNVTNDLLWNYSPYSGFDDKQTTNKPFIQIDKKQMVNAEDRNK